MCKQCGNSLHIEERHDEEVNQGRRHLVITGSALGAYAAAGGSLLGASSAASAAPAETLQASSAAARAPRESR